MHQGQNFPLASKPLSDKLEGKNEESLMVRAALFSLLLTAGLSAEETATEDIAKVSEAFGHLIGKNMEAIGVDLDLPLVVKGLRDEAQGKQSPLSESECIEALSSAQEKAFQKKAEENLAAAEAFLKQNANDERVVSLEDGKIQYKIEKEGTGTAIREGASPMLKYVGKFLDGSVFGKSQDGQRISLEEAIPGFARGLVGMKEGEMRILYVHPEYGYGTKGYLPPNSLLTFEIEAVKAHAEEETFSNDALILEGESKATNAPDDLDAPQVR